MKTTTKLSLLSLSIAQAFTCGASYALTGTELTNMTDPIYEQCIPNGIGGCLSNRFVYVAEAVNPVYAGDNVTITLTANSPVDYLVQRMTQYSYFVNVKNAGTLTLGNNFKFISNAEYYKYDNLQDRFVVFGSLNQPDLITVQAGDNLYIKGHTAFNFERSWASINIGSNATIDAERIAMVLGGRLDGTPLPRSTATVGANANFSGGDLIGLVLAQYNSEIFFNQGATLNLVSTLSNANDTETNLLRTNGRQALIKLTQPTFNINHVGSTISSVFKFTNNSRGPQPDNLNPLIPFGFSQAILVDNATLNINLPADKVGNFAMINGRLGSSMDLSSDRAASYMNINNMVISPSSTPGGRLAQFTHDGQGTKSDFLADVSNSDLRLLSGGIVVDQTLTTGNAAGSEVAFNFDHSQLAGPATNNSGMDLTINLKPKSTYDGDINNNKDGSITVNLDQGSSLTGGTNNNGSGTLDLSINNGSTWHNTGNNSSLSNLDINNGTVEFAQPPGVSDAGRTITVNNLDSNNGHILSYVGEDENKDFLIDKIVIDGGQTKGNTTFNIIDLTNDVERIAQTADTNPPILDSINGGSFDHSQFGGDIKSGLNLYDIEVRENGTFLPILASKKPTETTEAEKNVITHLNEGFLSPIVNTLGNFQNNFLNSQQNQVNLEQNPCEGRQSFAQIDYGTGESGFSVGGSQDINQTTLKLGSDLYNYSLSHGCVMSGVIFSHHDLKGDMHSQYYGDIGQNKTVGNTLGLYTRYVGNNHWYGSVAISKYIGSTDINLYGRPTVPVDSDAIAISGELGKEFKISDQLSIRASGQAIYLHSNIDDANDGYNRITYDKINTGLFRAGTSISYRSSFNEMPINALLNIDLWHQPSSQGTIHGYSTMTGSYAGSAEQNYGMTWGELNTQLRAQLNRNTYVHAGVKYKGRFNNKNNLMTAQLGITYLW